MRLWLRPLIRIPVGISKGVAVTQMGTMRSMMIGVAFLALACKGGEPSDGNEPTADDRDGDGLTDVEEAYIGSNPDAADTDRDGWDDFTEVESYTQKVALGLVILGAVLIDMVKGRWRFGIKRW